MIPAACWRYDVITTLINRSLRVHVQHTRTRATLSSFICSRGYKRRRTESTIFTAFKAFAEFLGTIYKTVRFPSTLGFTSAAFAGVVLAGSLIDLGIVWLLMFSTFSAALGFVVNDLSDVELDRLAGVIRNPVSTGELSRGRCISVAIFLLLVSMAALSSLSLQNQLLGLVVIFLYLTYSWLVRAKARPILDIAYHGFCLAILATMGYTEYFPFDVKCLLFVSIVFLLSSMSQILQEVRDYETDRNMIRTTVTLLGKRRSLILCLALFASSFPIFLLLFLKGAVPLEMLILSPLTYFIIAPITQAIVNEAYEEKMLREIRERRLIMIALLIATLILGRIYDPQSWLNQTLKTLSGLLEFARGSIT